jgi:undecaprenyl-diphosphatase
LREKSGFDRARVTRPGLALGLLVLCVAAFILVAWATTTDWGRALDRALLSSLLDIGEETFPRGPKWVREAGRDLTALGSISVMILLSLAVFGWLALVGRWRSLVVGAISIAMGTLASFGLKLLFSQERPDLVTQVTQTFTTSFPSSHAMGSLITFMTLAFALSATLSRPAHRFYLIALAILASLVAGSSRVYLGVHWPSDVVAGWLAGLAWMAMVILLTRRWLADEQPSGQR